VGFPIEIESKTEESADFREFSVEVGDLGNAGNAGEVDVEVAPVELGIGRGSRWIAVAGGLGYVPVAPGTAGSLGGVLLFLLVVSAGAGLSRVSFALLYALGVGSLLVLGIRAAGRAEVDFGRRDDGRIVIDEVVGQLIALAPLIFLLPSHSAHSGMIAGEDFFQLIPEVVTGFVLFRLFDVWKPGAVRWAECRFEGGLGVMADDVVAGLYAGLCLFVCLFVLQMLDSGVSGVSGVVLGVSA